MAKWILSDEIQAKLASLSQCFEQNLKSNEEIDDDYHLLKKFCKTNFENTTTTSSCPKETHIDSFLDKDYYEPLLDGVWKQSFVQDLIDDEEDMDTMESDSDEEFNEDVPTSAPEPPNNTQQDSFLAELSQMFK